MTKKKDDEQEETPMANEARKQQTDFAEPRPAPAAVPDPKPAPPPVAEPAPPPPASEPRVAQPMVTVERENKTSRIPGGYTDPEQINARLTTARKNFHLVTGTTSCGTLPEGFEVAFSMVTIDIAGETYSTEGNKLGLSKSALDKIGAAAGVSWDPQQSRRLDDRSHPHYCEFLAVGTVPQFDNSRVVIMGRKEMDLRDGSEQADKAGKNLRNMRIHIVSHAETKARLRALRSLGIRTGYTADDLKKPFVVARIMFTGRTNDPVLRHAFAMKQAEAALGGGRALYGAPVMPALQGEVHPPPAVPAPADDDDENAGNFDDRDANGGY